MENSKKIIISVLGVALLFVGGGVIFFRQQNGEGEELKPEQSGEVVAKVNGEEIKSDEIKSVQQMLSQQGQEISEENALDQLINQKVIFQEVEKQGYSVSNEEAEAVIEEQISAQGGSLEEYKQELENQGVSYDEQLENIKKELAAQNYLADNINGDSIEVTDEETEQYYEMYKNQESDSEEELPSFDELEAQIIAALQQQKEQEAVNSLIQELRQDAEIEYL